MGNQFHKKEVETYWKWNRLGFNWNVMIEHKHCQKCKFKCYKLKDAREHQKTHKIKNVELRRNN